MLESFDIYLIKFKNILIKYSKIVRNFYKTKIFLIEFIFFQDKSAFTDLFPLVK